MRKLTFEKAILIVFAAIIFISTTEIREKYTDIFKGRFLNKDTPVSAEVQLGNSPGFVSMLYNADNLYKEGRYEEAEMEYYTLTLNSALIIEQKSRANFGLAMCQYHLGKYKLAFQSFLTAASFSPSNSIIYNNAAVSAYRAEDMEHAIEYQLKALNLLPAVEYYYNLARMYEDDEQYNLAVDNYLAVTGAEQNLTKIDKIDPVRVKEKVARLSLNSQKPEINKVLIGYKLSNVSYEVLTVNENEMKLKPGDFTVKVDDQRTTKKIAAEYDRKKNDPYNLITELLWTVYRDGKQIYKKSGEKVSISTSTGGSYEVRLNIRYSGNEEKIWSKTITINNNSSTVDELPGEKITTNPPIKRSDKTYEYALYEQLFENGFNISDYGYIDKYNVVWGKDDISTQLIKGQAVDKLSSLYVKNYSSDYAGIWLNFDSLIKRENLASKKINIRFFARKVTEKGVLDIKARVKTEDKKIILSQKSFDLDAKWKEYSMDISIPRDAVGLTFSIKTEPGDEFMIDKFLIVD